MWKQICIPSDPSNSLKVYKFASAPFNKDICDIRNFQLSSTKFSSRYPRNDRSSTTFPSSATWKAIGFTCYKSILYYLLVLYIYTNYHFNNIWTFCPKQKEIFVFFPTCEGNIFLWIPKIKFAELNHFNNICSSFDILNLFFINPTDATHFRLENSRCKSNTEKNCKKWLVLTSIMLSPF